MDDPSWAPDPHYARYAGHDLAQVPLVVLEAARAALRTASEYDGAVDPDDVEPLAAMVVAVVVPIIVRWVSETHPGWRS
jgi:hypothetical protein